MNVTLLATESDAVAAATTSPWQSMVANGAVALFGWCLGFVVAHLVLEQNFLSSLTVGFFMSLISLCCLGYDSRQFSQEQQRMQRNTS